MTDDSGGTPPNEAPTGRGERRRDASPTPLSDSAFPGFDAAIVPPKPELPAEQPGMSTGEHNAIREQWRAKRGEFENHVSHAKDQLDQANERIKERTGRDLIVAILIGLAAGAVLLGSLLFIKWLFVPIVLAIALLSIYELGLALRGAGRRIDLIPQLVAGAPLVLAGYFAEPWLCWVALFASVSFVIVWRLVAQMMQQDGRTYGEVLGDVVVAGFVQVYVPFLASIALILLSQEGGQWWALAFIAVAVAADTGAYASGLAFGKHPMAPRISPKKTWEGFAGAVVAAAGVGVLLALFLLEMPWWAGVILGASVLLSATLGDLAESMLKRDLGIKDMSSWLPGHGGLLDRLDSILPSTIPALTLYFLLSPWATLG
ncbi:phosphatidate cytidylyltransferase [Microbacterium sp. ZKA21]|uniref:phosphatidate cytidylyltransferase n=1 Tax=Microbacterium sp. ZKA21 TaxID=3381694 RepID=UPI003D1F09FB